MIQEIKNLKKEEIFKKPETDKFRILNKILTIFGHGKKR